MPTPFFQVDSFTATPFHGNPAGVCLLTDKPGNTETDSRAVNHFSPAAPFGDNHIPVSDFNAIPLGV